MIKPVKILVVLGGGLVKNSDGTFRTTTFAENGDRHGILGDRLRVLAASQLWCADQARIIVASGGQGFLEQLGPHPDIATVIKRELEELKVPAEKITEENFSDTSYQQLVNLKKMLIGKKVDELLLITNRWHAPRLGAMIEHQPELKDFYKPMNLRIISAEEIVLKNEPKQWQKIITDAYQSPAMDQRQQLEKQGLEQIKNGTYLFK